MVKYNLTTDAIDFIECPACEDLLPIETRCFEIAEGSESLKFTCPTCNHIKICEIEVEYDEETRH